VNFSISFLMGFSMSFSVTDWWRVGLVGWQTSPVALAGLCAEAALAIGYLAAARHDRRAGRRWSALRTAAFMTGLLTLMLSLQSGFAGYDDIFWVHVVQHQLLMTLAPVLLVLGAPLILILRVLPAQRARQLVGVLHCRPLNWMNGPSAAVHLPLHYYGATWLYLLTPAYALAQRNAAFHELAHAYFIGCGVMFWLPLLGRYPSRWHPPRRTKIRMVAIGLPVNLALGALLAVTAPINGSTGARDSIAGIDALTVGGVFFTMAGLALVHITGARQRGRRPVQVGMAPSATAMAVSRRA
jgi:cytochrome c oxidase assembly factor CtaG